MAQFLKEIVSQPCMNDFAKRIVIKLTKEQIRAINKALGAGALTIGEGINNLKTKLKELTGYKHVWLTDSGFTSLLLTFKALSEIKIFREVWTVPIATCFSTINAIKESNFKIKYFDYGDTNLRLEKNFGDKFSNAIIFVPNYFGKIAIQTKTANDSFIVEDGAQSFLSNIRQNRKSDVFIGSFSPTKWINGINGGFILTDNSRLYQTISKIGSLRSQTKPSSQVKYNFDLNNINASLALTSLQNLNRTTRRLCSLHRYYCKLLSEEQFSFLDYDSFEVPTRFIMFAKSKKMKTKFLRQLNSKGIEASSELLKVCTNTKFENLNNSKAILHRSFSLPFHPYMSKDDLEQIVSEILIT